jgi:hypothetical protein
MPIVYMSQKLIYKEVLIDSEYIHKYWSASSGYIDQPIT